MFYFTSLEKCCQVQLLADAAGDTVKIDDEDAEITYKTVGTARGGWFSGLPAFQVLEAKESLKFRSGKADA